MLQLFLFCTSQIVSSRYPESSRKSQLINRKNIFLWKSWCCWHLGCFWPWRGCWFFPGVSTEGIFCLRSASPISLVFYCVGMCFCWPRCSLWPWCGLLLFPSRQSRLSLTSLPSFDSSVTVVAIMVSLRRGNICNIGTLPLTSFSGIVGALAHVLADPAAISDPVVGHWYFLCVEACIFWTLHWLNPWSIFCGLWGVLRRYPLLLEFLLCQIVLSLTPSPSMPLTWIYGISVASEHVIADLSTIWIPGVSVVAFGMLCTANGFLWDDRHVGDCLHWSHRIFLPLSGCNGCGGVST